MTVDDSGAARLSRYWSLDPGREIRLGDDGEYAEALRELFIEAVRRRLPAGDTVAASLSGGLDSTSVSTVAARYATASVHSISLTFPGLPSVDEQRWIEPAVHSGGFVPHAMRGDEIDPFEMIDRMLVHEDGIFWAPNLYLHWAMYERASQTGAKVFLDGVDGDSTLSHGLGYPRELLLDGHWRRAGREVRALARRTGRPLHRQARRVLLPNGTGLQTRLRRAPERPPAWDGFGIVAPAFAARLRLPERYEALSGQRRRSPRRERDAHYRQLERPLHAYALEAADRAAAAHGIEPRYPFYDISLVEFCLALPGEQKLRAGWTRWVMRGAMEGILPPAVQWRHGKSNLGPVLAQAIHRRGGPAVEELLRDSDAIAPYVDVRALRVRWERFGSDPSPADVMPIWLSLVLHRGLRVGAERWPGTTSAGSTATESTGSPARPAPARSR
jgi:asparagine synthase (glutamine-hydrolysing)